MFELYNEQEKAYQLIKKELIDTPYLQNIYLNKKMFISGEMGVGKTYIGTKAIVNYIYDNQTFGLIFCPAQVIKKWHKVLMEAINTYHYDIQVKELKRNNTFSENENPKNMVSLKANTIYILANSSLNVFTNANIKYLKTLSILPFMIFDEVHELKGAKLHGLSNCIVWDNNNMSQIAYLKGYSPQGHMPTTMLYNLYNNGELDAQLEKKIPMLFLTGTIFNKDWKSIFELLSITHPLLLANAIDGHDHTDLIANNIYNYPNDRYNILPNIDAINSSFNNIFEFINRVWQYISISLSIDDVKEIQATDDNEIKQLIMPIKPFPLTNEQQMFLNIARHQLKRLQVSNIETRIMNWIDDPSKTLTFKRNVHVRKNRFKTNSYNYISFPLIPIALNKTVKYKKLTEIIHNTYNSNDIQNKRYLIYANDKTLIEKLKTLLGKQYKTFSLPDNIDTTMYGQYIKDKYNEDYEIAIVQPNKISVGIDIEADYLIWYQLTNDYSQMLQATRRVYRLSSKRKSSVYFLIYQDTQQEKMVNELSNSTKNNAATYGEQSTDNLTKITGILLNNIKTI